MKNVQYLLAAFGLFSAVSSQSSYVSGYSNETTVWTTVTTDVSTLSETRLFFAQCSSSFYFRDAVSEWEPRDSGVSLRLSLFFGNANSGIKVYTTYCPESTTFTQGTKTYTATASETLTITGELSNTQRLEYVC